MKPGYKQTDVGVIPEEWEVKTIDQIGFVTSGKRLPLGNLLVKQPTPHPYIRACPKIRGFRSDFFRLFIWLAQLNLWVLKMASNGVIRFDSILPRGACFFCDLGAAFPYLPGCVQNLLLEGVVSIRRPALSVNGRSVLDFLSAFSRSRPCGRLPISYA